MFTKQIRKNEEKGGLEEGKKGGREEGRKKGKSNCSRQGVLDILFLFKFIYLCIYLFICCVESFLLCPDLPWLQRAGATLCCGAWASHGGFSRCGARAPGTRASVAVARGL